MKRLEFLKTTFLAPFLAFFVSIINTNSVKCYRCRYPAEVTNNILDGVRGYWLKCNKCGWEFGVHYYKSGLMTGKFYSAKDVLLSYKQIVKDGFYNRVQKRTGLVYREVWKSVI